jgi:hypothetical protein
MLSLLLKDISFVLAEREAAAAAVVGGGLECGESDAMVLALLCFMAVTVFGPVFQLRRCFDGEML